MDAIVRKGEVIIHSLNKARGQANLEAITHKSTYYII